MANAFVLPRFNRWTVFAIAGTAGLLLIMVVWFIWQHEWVSATPTSGVSVAPIDTRSEAESMVHKAEVVAHIATPVPTPAAIRSVTVRQPPTQEEMTRIVAAQQRKEHEYGSGGLVAAFHNGSNVLDLASHRDMGRTPERAQAHRVGLQAAEGPDVIMQGERLHAQLLDDVTTSITNVPITAQLIEAGMDSLTHRKVVIPAGSRLIGKYDTNVGDSQEGVRVEWTRIVLPDTSSFDVPEMAAAVDGATDNHYFKRFALASVLGLLSAGGSVAGTVAYGGGSYGAYPSGPEMAKQQFVQGMSQQFASQGQSAVQERMYMRPTITIRKGTVFDVMVQGDLSR